MKNKLLVFDFDGLLIDSYSLLKEVFATYGLDLGDENRFKNRRKFLKYVGGGKEFLANLAIFSLPNKKTLRADLTEVYREEGKIFEVFVDHLNTLIQSPTCHVGILSRNFTYESGVTIRKVLENSGVEEKDLDFVVPVSAGTNKRHVLLGMSSKRYDSKIFTGDEISDYKAAQASHYIPFIASYGFDDRNRLITKGEISEEIIYDSPSNLVLAVESTLSQRQSHPFG